MYKTYRKDSGRILFHGSENLLDWEYLSEYYYPELPGKYECPLMRPVAINDHYNKWILKWDIPYRSYYITGTFNGREFIPDNTAESLKSLDNGNFYASISWNHLPDERTIIMGWITEEPCKNKAWTGVQSVPRALSFSVIDDNCYLIQQPIKEIKNLRGKHYSYSDMSVKKLNRLFTRHKVNGKSLEINAQIKPNNAEAFAINFFGSNKDSISVYYDTKNDTLSILNGFKPYKAKLTEQYGYINLHIYIDHSVVEVFANDGQVVLTGSYFPDPSADRLSFYEKGGEVSVDYFEVYKLNSIYAK